MQIKYFLLVIILMPFSLIGQAKVYFLSIGSSKYNINSLGTSDGFSDAIGSANSATRFYEKFNTIGKGSLIKSNDESFVTRAEILSGVDSLINLVEKDTMTQK